MKLNYSFNVHYSIYNQLNYTRLKNVGDSKDTKEQYLLTPGIKISLNPKLHLFGFYQYDKLDKVGRLNVKFEWEYRPLSYFFIVFNNFKDNLNRIDQQQYIGKVNLLHQF